MKIFERDLNELLNKFKMAPWGEENFYKNWLAQTYYYVRYSTRLLAYAAGLTPFEDSSYEKRLLEHIDEESNHEKLALKDLEKMKAQISEYEEFGVTRSFYESQFFKISQNPYSLLGYVLALELLAVEGPKLIFSKLEEAYGKDKLTFIRVHANEDVEHVKSAISALDQLDSKNRDFVIQNFKQSCEMYGLILDQCKAKTESGLNHLSKSQVA